MSIINSQIMQFDDKKEIKNALVDSQSKVRSVALVYDRLSENLEADFVPSKRFFEELVDSLKNTYDTNDRSIDFNMNLEDHPIAGNKAVPLGLVLNELLTRVLKHNNYKAGDTELISLNFFKTQEGNFELVLSHIEEEVFREIKVQSSKHYGLQMVNGLIAEINGVISLDESKKGLRIRF